MNSTTKCNFDPFELMAKNIFVSKASRLESQSRHNLSTPEHKLNDIIFIFSWKTKKLKPRKQNWWIDISRPLT